MTAPNFTSMSRENGPEWCPCGAERLQDQRRVAVYLRHELSHLQDMVDPAFFGYVPELTVSHASVSQQRLARQRYTVLWDTSIDGRLIRSGRSTIATRQERRLEFTNTFGFSG